MQTTGFMKSFFSFSYGPIVSAAISFITIPLITLFIIPDEFGKASMFLLVYSIMLQIALLGTDQSFVRFFYEQHKEERGKLLYNSIFPSMIMAIIIVCILCLFNEYTSLLLTGENNKNVVIYLSALVFISIFNRFGELIARMEKKGNVYSLIMIVGNIVNSVFVLIYAYFIQANFIAIIFALLGSNILKMFLYIYIEREYWFSYNNIDWLSIREILIYGIPLVPAFFMYTSLEAMTKMMLRYYTNFHQLGLYTTAFKLNSVLAILQTSFITFWMPIAFSYYERNPEKTIFFKFALHRMAAILYAFALVLIILKNKIILIFDINYYESVNIFPFLIFQPILYTLSEIVGYGINFKKKTNYQIIVIGSVLLFNIFMSYMMIPLFGAKGAAVAFGSTFIIFFFVRSFVSGKFYYIEYNWGKIYGGILLMITSILNSITGENMYIYCVIFVLLFYLFYEEYIFIYSYIKKNI